MRQNIYRKAKMLYTRLMQATLAFKKTWDEERPLNEKNQALAIEKTQPLAKSYPVPVDNSVFWAYVDSFISSQNSPHTQRAYLKDLTHSTQIGMYVLAGTLVVGAFAVWRTPAQLVNR